MKWGNCNFDDLKKFQAELEKLDMHQVAIDSVNEAVGKINRRVKINTPRVTGTMRKHWKQEVEDRKDTVVGTIYNDATADGAPYPLYVEYGHRIVRGGKTLGYAPPQYILTKEMAKIENGELEKIIKKHVMKKIGDTFE